MNKIKEIIKQFDLYPHTTFQRYKQEDFYLTLTSGIFSIVLIIFFICISSILILGAINRTTINSSKTSQYDHSPIESVLVSSPENNFMFAVGINGLDLQESKRYFDIGLTNIAQIRNGKLKNISKVVVPLLSCTQEHWNNFTDKIIQNQELLNIDEWLCPPNGQQYQLQGHYISSILKYSQIVVSKCTENNILYPGTTCANESQVADYLKDNGNFVFSFYFVNKAINAGLENYIDYYLQDRNSFTFDTKIGVISNLYFSDFTVLTDNSLMPWPDNQEVKGVQVVQQASIQNYYVQSNNNEYLKFNIRNGGFNNHYTRSYQKLDNIFSYIGGLFAIVIALTSFLKLYNKLSYELSMGDHIFKQNNNSSFGSQNFNFISFLGYSIYALAAKLSICVNWDTMKKYHKCIVQCQKQLSIDLYFSKMTHFQQISKLLLEEHHRIVLLMAPKPTIDEVRKNRKKFQIKKSIYHHLERKGAQINVEEKVYQQRIMQYVKGVKKQRNPQQNTQTNDPNYFRDQAIISYEILQNQLKKKQPLSKKLMNLLGIQDMRKAIYHTISKQPKMPEIRRSSILIQIEDNYQLSDYSGITDYREQ